MTLSLGAANRALRDVPGVGPGQPANALRIYDALSVLPQILAAGFIYDYMFIFGPHRELIVDHKRRAVNATEQARRFF